MIRDAVPLLLVGCGKMGGAMLAGWRARGFKPEDIVVVEPWAEQAAAVRVRHGVSVFPGPEHLPDDLKPAVMVVAVKPQVMDEAVPHYRHLAERGAWVLSIAAGTTIGYFENRLGADAAIVRAMPNTPASIGRGITALCANARVTEGEREAAKALVEAVGEAVWVEDEALMDVVTAVSGSGPAYVFLLIEALARAGEANGLPSDVAVSLAEATVAGAGELARQSDEMPAELRRHVTSPGGTTEAALKVLMAKDGLQDLLDRAVHAAVQRGRELGS
jgi:pyrroline-5-carboxylate reductase